MKITHPTIRVLVAALALIAASVFPCHGQSEARNIRLSVGEIRDLSVAFDIKGFVPGNRDIVQAQVVGAQKLSVTAMKVGSTDIKITGDGEQTETFKITVGSTIVDIYEILREIRKDLDNYNILGVEGEVGLGKVVLRGIITNPMDWKNLMQEILPNYSGDQVVCKVQFKLQPEKLLGLKTLLESAGFKVVEGNAANQKPGTLNLSSSDNRVIISGSVFARGDLDAIEKSVTDCGWLTVLKKGEKPAKDVCHAVINVPVAPVLLSVDVCFVGVTDDELLTLGANLLNGTLGFVQGAANIAGSVVHGPQGYSSYFAGASMSGTIKAMSGGAGIGPSRFSSVGHLTFKNDAPEWKTYKDGGTVQLESSGGVGTTSTRTPIEYGFIIKVKGGLSDAENAALDLNVELSVPIAKGRSFDLKQTRMDTTISCPIGKTVILGGHKELTEGVSIDSETPILGKIPILQFLFSERTKTKSQRQVLTMVSVQLNRPPTASAPVSDQTADTQKKADQPLSILKPGLK